ncbi:MAG: hypothetical protein AB7I41_01295 [Candidatus Sericytochromatia bacterium]
MVEPSIGQSEFESRRAKFEKAPPKQSELEEETRSQMESMINQISPQELINNSQLFGKTGLLPLDSKPNPENSADLDQVEVDLIEEVEIEEQPLSANLNLPPQTLPLNEEQDSQLEKESLPQAKNDTAPLNQPQSQPPSQNIESEEEVTEVENSAENANSNMPKPLPQHPDVDKTVEQESVEPLQESQPKSRLVPGSELPIVERPSSPLHNRPVPIPQPKQQALNAEFEGSEAEEV